MRDHERAEVGADETLDAARDRLQRVDVEARVGLVEHRDPRLQHRHLQDLDPLLLAAGEAVVQVARGELAADLELVHLLEQLLAELRDRDRIVHAAVSGLARRVDRAAQEARDGDAGDGLRILEREEEAALGTLVGAELRDVLAVEQQGAFGDLVGGVAHDRVGERRLPRPVRAHHRVDLTLRDLQVDALDDLRSVLERDMEVPQLQYCHSCDLRSSKDARHFPRRDSSSLAVRQKAATIRACPT